MERSASDAGVVLARGWERRQRLDYLPDLDGLARERGRCEAGLAVLTVVAPHPPALPQVLVVLEESGAAFPAKYHVHRYWHTDARGWTCSADGDRVGLEAVWSWLTSPTPLATRMGHHVRPARACDTGRAPAV